MVTVLDSVEDGNISEYGGDTGSFSTSTDQAYDGNVSISLDSRFAAITRTDQTIAVGETPFGGWGAADVQSPASSGYSITPKFVWGVQSETGVDNLTGYAAGVWYEESFDNPTYSFEVIRYDNGSPTSLSSVSVSVTELDWYETRVTQWESNGDMTIKLRDSAGSTLTTLTLNDDTYGTGGWGWVDDSGVGSFPCYFDYSYKTDPLTAPANVQITDASVEDELTVDWDEASSANGYYIYRAEASGTALEDYTEIADVTAPPYTDTNLEDGEQYHYRVCSHL